MPCMTCLSSYSYFRYFALGVQLRGRLSPGSWKRGNSTGVAAEEAIVLEVDEEILEKRRRQSLTVIQITSRVQK